MITCQCQLLPSESQLCSFPQAEDRACGQQAFSGRERERAPVGESFTHLHLHTEFSMLDGAARVKDVIAAAVADGQPAIGITDHGNMYWAIDFYKEAKAQGVKPVLGTEVSMAGQS